MLAQTLLTSVLRIIFAKTAEIYNFPIGKHRRDFLAELFRVILVMRGRVNVTNMARFSALHERTFRRHFAKAFNWIAFNLVLLRLRRHPDERMIGSFDAKASGGSRVERRMISCPSEVRVSPIECGTK